MSAMGKLQAEGLVRHVGVSNFTAGPLAGGRGGPGWPGPLQPGQVQPDRPGPRGRPAGLGPGQRPHGHRLQPAQPGPACPAATTPTTCPAGCARGPRPSSPRTSARLAPVLDVLRQVAAAHDATCSQVALAWLVRRPNVVVIPGASSVAQAEANAAAADLELSDDEDAALSAASDAYDPIRGAAAVPPLVRVQGRAGGRPASAGRWRGSRGDVGRSLGPGAIRLPGTRATGAGTGRARRPGRRRARGRGDRRACGDDDRGDRSTTSSSSAGAPAGTPPPSTAPPPGSRIAVVERDKVGGTCLHRGCVPAKEFLETASVNRTVGAVGGVRHRRRGPDRRLRRQPGPQERGGRPALPGPGRSA